MSEAFSALTSATLPLAGTEIVPLAIVGTPNTNAKTTTAAIAALSSGPLVKLTPSSLALVDLPSTAALGAELFSGLSAPVGLRVAMTMEVVSGGGQPCLALDDGTNNVFVVLQTDGNCVFYKGQGVTNYLSNNGAVGSFSIGYSVGDLVTLSLELRGSHSGQATLTAYGNGVYLGAVNYGWNASGSMRAFATNEETTYSLSTLIAAQYDITTLW